MASIINYDGGLKRIEFCLTPNGPRKAVRLGRVSVKTAETWKARIEAIISDKLANRHHDNETSEWLAISAGRQASPNRRSKKRSSQRRAAIVSK